MSNPVICAGCHEPERWAVFNDGQNHWYCCDCWEKQAIKEWNILGAPYMAISSKGEVLFSMPSWMRNEVHVPRNGIMER